MKQSGFDSAFQYKTLVMCLLLSITSVGQDIQFSQFYAVPLYQNPAFAGSAFLNRVVLHQRFQWMRLDARFASSYASWDNHYDKIRGGIGVMASHDYQGGDKIISDDIAVQYATEVQLNEKFALRAGAQLALGWRTIDYSRFQYSQDYTDQGYQGNTYNQYGSERFFYPDLALGTVLYTEKMWFGISSHHINEPKQTFYSNINNKLPMKLAFTGGYKYVIKQYTSNTDYFKRTIEYNLIPTAHYKMQGKSDQLDLGLYSQMDKLLLGVWYRGIPIKRLDGIQNNESTVILAGLKYHHVVFTYSYDLTLSRLSRARTGGSHELNLTLYFEKKKKTVRPMKRLPCPDYFD